MSSNAPIIAHFSVTPTTQMVISDAKTLIIDSGGNNMVTTTRLSLPHQLVSTGESRASQSGKVTKVSITHQPSSSLHERKKSVGRPGKISPLKENFADQSPYVSAETAALLKKHLARKGINNNGAPMQQTGMLNTASTSNLPSNTYVGLGREPLVIAEGSKRLRRNSKMAKMES